MDLQSILKSLIERTGNLEMKEKQVTVRSLRHSIAIPLLEQGIAVEQVRMFLGHSQFETTQFYTHISQKQLEDLINRFFSSSEKNQKDMNLLTYLK